MGSLGFPSGTQSGRWRGRDSLLEEGGLCNTANVAPYTRWAVLCNPVNVAKDGPKTLPKCSNV
jgi:hypothetical protein